MDTLLSKYTSMRIKAAEQIQRSIEKMSQSPSMERVFDMTELQIAIDTYDICLELMRNERSNSPMWLSEQLSKRIDVLLKLAGSNQLKIAYTHRVGQLLMKQISLIQAGATP